MTDTVADQYATWINRAATALDLYRKRALEVEQRDTMSFPANAKMQATAELRQQFADALRQMETELGKTLADYQAAYQNSFAVKPKDATEELLFEHKQDRAWRNIRTLIDYATANGQKLEDVVAQHAKQAAKKGDMLTITALRNELPMYMVSTVGNIAPDNAQMLVDDLVMNACDGHLTKDQATAKYNLTTAKQYFNRAAVAIREAMHSLDKPLNEPVTLPAITPGETVVVHPALVENDPKAGLRELQKMGFTGVTISDFDEAPK